jgi:hypothetical protein
MKNRLKICLIAILLGVCIPLNVNAATQPYPSSQIITNLAWDFGGMSRAAVGSDLFPLTWADDDNLYTAWGDGWGFSESGEKKALGVSRVSGPATAYTGSDLWYEVGKSNGGIISIDGVLYIYVQEQNFWTRCKLWKSTDLGATWTDLGWILDEPGGVFAEPGIIQFGKNYSGSRDNYVYGYSSLDRSVTTNKDIYLFRVPKDQLANRAAYEFFSGTAQNPSWSSNIDDKKSVFHDETGVGWGVNCSYHAQSQRYLLTVRHDDTGGWGIFDAPEPWGPWTTVAYYDNWIDSSFKFTFVFNQKWTSVDGRTLWMVFSGTGGYDSFNVIEATIDFNTAPAAPTNLKIIDVQ